MWANAPTLLSEVGHCLPPPPPPPPPPQLGYGGHESEKTYYHFCADTIMTTKEIKGNEICGFFVQSTPLVVHMHSLY